MNASCKESEAFSCSSSTPSFPAAGSVSSCSNCSITFVHANPANFRALVQKLTGALNDYAANIPVASPADSVRKPPPTASKRQKLQKRRRALANLEICSCYPTSSSCRRVRCCNVSSSPDSIVDSTSVPVSSSCSADKEDEMKRGIAEEGFYLHSSLTKSEERPKLLPLFPLHSSSNPSAPT